jgi:5-methylcytosine-specific restriction endonuclease McrA
LTLQPDEHRIAHVAAAINRAAAALVSYEDPVALYRRYALAALEEVQRLDAPLAEGDVNLTVSCGHCGGNVVMVTCDAFRGTGHEWVLMSACMVCRNVHWVDGGCRDKGCR